MVEGGCSRPREVVEESIMIEAKQLSASSIVCVFLACLSGTWLDAEGLPADPNEPEPESDVVIELTRFEITAQTLEIRYDIRNDSNEAVWVCADIDENVHIDFATCVSDDGHALQVIRRADLPPCGLDLAYEYSRFARLHPGQTRAEVLSLDLPIFAPRLTNGAPLTQNGSVVRGLSVDIGCYADQVLEWARYSRTFRQTSDDEFLTYAFSATQWPEELTLALQAGIEGVRVPLEVGDAESYPVYLDLLPQWFPRATQVVLKAETVWRYVNVDYLRGRVEGAREDTLRDFRRKNLVSVPLEQERIAAPNVVVVTNPLADGWEAFRERYPDSSGLTELSCVGFSEDHTQALVYVGSSGGGRVGSGWVTLLEWNGSAWEIQEFVRVWVS